MSTCEGSIKVLVNFPSGVKLTDILQALIADYPCLENVEELSQTQLLLNMDSIVELLDIDFVNSYGATSTRLIDPRESTESIKYRLENLNSTLHQSESKIEPQSLFELEKYIQDLELSPQEILPPKRVERLTSLEDEILEDEKINNFFLVCPSSHSGIGWSSESEEKEMPYTTLEEELAKDEACPKKQEEIGWLPIVNGIACTALLVGGIKAISFFFNR